MEARRRPKPKRRPAATSRHPPMKPKGRAEAAALARLRVICCALPGVTEKVAWGEPTWRTGKIFAQMDTHHHGAEHMAVWLPARPGVQEALVEENPAQFFRPPYVGHKGWIGVRIDRRPDWRIVAGLVAEARLARRLARARGGPGVNAARARVAPRTRAPGSRS